MSSRHPVSASLAGPREPRASGSLVRELRSLARLFPYMWPGESRDLRHRVGLAVLCLVIGKLINVAIPLVYKHAVDALTRVSEGGVAAVPVALIIGYGLVRIGAQGFNELRDAVFARVEQHAVRRIGLETFRHLHRLSLRFHLERQTGGLSRSIERGIRSVEFLLSYTIFNVAPTLFEMLLVCGILWRLYNASFALVTLATILCYMTFTFSVTEWRIKFRREMNERDTEANTKAVDSLLNFETVKYFANEEHEARRFDTALRHYERAAVLSQTTLSLLNVGQGTIIACGLVGIMLLAARGVAQGSMTVGDFVLVNTFLLQLYQPLNLLGLIYRNIKQSLTDLERMFGLLDVAPEIRDRPGAKPLAVSAGEIVFDNVHFHYDPRRPILKGVSFRVPPGRTVAIVGPSGTGKSTITRLLFRFYDVAGGAIRIDGQDLREVTQDSLRRSIGVVPQDTVLFNDTIFYNIAYGKPGSDAAQVAAAARLARIHDFITGLPDGYGTQVGERGLKLSGGEKQRVAIARVILKQPRILVFDEATSALDTRTEREIQASLKEVSLDRTTLVIAHRLSTIVDADEILVLEAGRIVERGCHGDLLARCGTYAQMWARQQQADADEAETEGAEREVAE
jgi:ATP-binding cassette, subfamily B, heavy metal transporter